MTMREYQESLWVPHVKAVLFLSVGLLVVSSASAASIHAGDRDALLSVKAAFGTSSWVTNLLKSWSKSNVKCETWYGVTCNTAGRVEKINLSNQGLEGTLSSSIGNLTYLQELQISLNYFTGGIPESIGKLINLKILDLSEQDKPFGGKIPASIGNLINLEYLYLAYNKFNGTIPESIGKLTKLETLGLHYNNFEGKIPSSIKALRRLQNLQLYQNYFTGSLAIDANFTKAWIFDNFFSGPLNITIKGKPYCDAIIARNCVFSPNSQWGCGKAEYQSNVTTCAAFCHANKKEGACGGHGTCSSITSSCSCDEGYKPTKDKKYCFLA